MQNLLCHAAKTAKRTVQHNTAHDFFCQCNSVLYAAEVAAEVAAEACS